MWSRRMAGCRGFWESKDKTTLVNFCPIKTIFPVTIHFGDFSQDRPRKLSRTFSDMG